MKINEKAREVEGSHQAQLVDTAAVKEWSNAQEQAQTQIESLQAQVRGLQEEAAIEHVMVLKEHGLLEDKLERASYKEARGKGVLRRALDALKVANTSLDELRVENSSLVAELKRQKKFYWLEMERLQEENEEVREAWEASQGKCQDLVNQLDKASKQADNKEEEEEVDEHDMVLASLQYSLLADREEAAEGAAAAAEEAAAAAAAAQETINQLEQEVEEYAGQLTEEMLKARNSGYDNTVLSGQVGALEKALHLQAEEYERALMKQGMDVKETKMENKVLRGQVGALQEALDASQHQANQAKRSDSACCEVSVQTLEQEEEEKEVDGHDMVLAGLQYSLLVSQEEAAENAAEAAAAAQDTISRLGQEAEKYERMLMQQGMDVKESKTENKALRDDVGALQEALQASQTQTNQRYENMLSELREEVKDQDKEITLLNDYSISLKYLLEASWKETGQIKPVGDMEMASSGVMTCAVASGSSKSPISEAFFQSPSAGAFSESPAARASPDSPFSGAFFHSPPAGAFSLSPAARALSKSPAVGAFSFSRSPAARTSPQSPAARAFSFSQNPAARAFSKSSPAGASPQSPAARAFAFSQSPAARAFSKSPSAALLRLSPVPSPAEQASIPMNAGKSASSNGKFTARSDTVITPSRQGVSSIKPKGFAGGAGPRSPLTPVSSAKDRGLSGRAGPRSPFSPVPNGSPLMAYTASPNQGMAGKENSSPAVAASFSGFRPNPQTPNSPAIAHGVKSPSSLFPLQASALNPSPLKPSAPKTVRPSHTFFSPRAVLRVPSAAASLAEGTPMDATVHSSLGKAKEVASTAQPGVSRFGSAVIHPFPAVMTPDTVPTSSSNGGADLSMIPKAGTPTRLQMSSNDRSSGDVSTVAQSITPVTAHASSSRAGSLDSAQSQACSPAVATSRQARPVVPTATVRSRQAATRSATAGKAGTTARTVGATAERVSAKSARASATAVAFNTRTRSQTAAQRHAAATTTAPSSNSPIASAGSATAVAVTTAGVTRHQTAVRPEAEGAAAAPVATRTRSQAAVERHRLRLLQSREGSSQAASGNSSSIRSGPARQRAGRRA